MNKINKRVYQGHLSRKRFGQNFLYDNSIIKSIIAAIQPQSNQVIVEIGPGLGALTEPMAKLVNKMTVIELDRNLIARLMSNPFFQSKLKIIQQDAITVDFAALSAEQGNSLRIFGNLPYNISTSLILHLFKYIHVIHDMHFMLQREVASRLMANKDSRAYGRLSVIAQYHCKIIPVLADIPSASFRPTSKVDSTVVRLTPHATLPFPVKKLSILEFLTNIAFNQRRKMLRNSLSNFIGIRQLAEHAIDTTLRAENVSVEDYCRLANGIIEQLIAQNSQECLDD